MPSQHHRVRIGTSGWQYQDWRGVLYPKGLAQSRWLERYAEVFDTVELNNSFYGLPSAEQFARWKQAIPPGFTVAAKFSRYLTHVRRLRDPSGPVHLFLERASYLGDHLGPVMLQLPPTLPKDAVGLENTLRNFPAHVKVAVEFRHPSWFSEDIEAILQSQNAALVWADRRGRLQNPQWRTADWHYLRLHGGSGPGGNYGDRVLDNYARTLARIEGDAFVYSTTTGRETR